MPDAAGWLAWLHGTALSTAMRGNPWMYPMVEIVHIAGFALLVGSVAMFDLRLLGFGRTLPVTGLARLLLPWSVASLLLVVPAGLILFAAQPLELAANRLFQVKLLLIALAGVNAALFHAGAYRAVAAWNTGAPAPPLARLHAVVSLALWVAVISCGRLLAYV